MNPSLPLQLLLLLLALTASAFSPRPHEPPPAKDLAAGNHAFAADLYDALRGDGGENLAFSPLSVRMAFAMARLGAAGTTDAEIARVLHFEGTAKDTGRAYRELTEAMQARNDSGAPRRGDREPAYALHVANSLWTQRGHPLRRAFVEQVRELLDGHAAPLDFAADPEHARETINAWIAKHTAGRIEELLGSDAITEDTKLVLANALHFVGQWEDPFSERATTDMTFWGPDGEVERPFMRATRHYGYHEDQLAQLVSLPFRGRKTMLTIVVPRARDGLGTVEAALDGAWLTAALAAVEAGKTVELALPRFSIGGKLELGDVLRRLGLEETLSERANFAKMSEQPLYVARAIHAAEVRVDEKGAEAAAATALVMKVGSAAPREPVKVIADRPFLFVIHERESAAILFLGRVARP